MQSLHKKAPVSHQVRTQNLLAVRHHCTTGPPHISPWNELLAIWLLLIMHTFWQPVSFLSPKVIKILFVYSLTSNFLGWPILLFLSMCKLAVPLNVDRQTAEVANHSVRAVLMKRWRTEIDLSASCALALSEQPTGFLQKLHNGY